MNPWVRRRFLLEDRLRIGGIECNSQFLAIYGILLRTQMVAGPLVTPANLMIFGRSRVWDYIEIAHS